MDDGRIEHAIEHEVEETVRDPLARRWTPRRIILQLLGFLIGIALFAWAVVMASAESNRVYIERIIEAPPRLLIGLIALTVLSIVFNALCFWAVVRPIKRLSTIDVISVNAISTVLSILPFKVSVLARAFIHYRRDAIGIRDLVSWFAAMSALSLAALLPALAATLWRGQADLLWWISAIAGPILCTALGVGVCMKFNHWRIIRISSIGGWRLLRSPAIATEQLLYRFIDLVGLAGRFWIGSRIIGLDLSLDQGLLLGTGYFLSAVLAPAGALGFAEMGATALGAAVGHDAGAVTSLALLITASQFPTAFVMAVAGWFRLRPDRLLVSRAPTVTRPDAGDA